MRKLFFTILLAGLAIMLVSWSFAGQTKVDQESSSTSVKAERAKSDAGKAVTGRPLSTQNKAVESKAPAYKTGTAGNNDQNADPSLDKAKQEALRIDQAAEEKAKMDSQREKQSPDMLETLKNEEAAAPVQETPAQAEPAKWQPIYGSKGELLNAEPSVQITPNDKGYEPSMLLTNLFSETFETAWDTTGVDHPINWINNDNGTAGTRFWSLDDWHKYYYSTFGSNCARINYYPSAETTFNEWLITPQVALTGGATACSLTWRNEYSHRTANDTAIVKISTDNGATWVDSLRWGASQSSGYKKINLTSYAGQTVKIAFVFRCNANPYTNCYYWYIDDVKFFADDATLLNENFESWGPGGNLPPTSWTILDSGVVKASAGYNLNDWQRYAASWGGNAARIYYVSSNPYDPEWQNDELITPAISISSGAACSLSVVEYYYHSTATPFENFDHGYLLVSTNGGTSWPETLVNHTVTIGTTSPKTTFKYSLNSHAGQSIMLKFKFVNSPIGSSYWIFDDVSVDETILLAHDVTTTSIVSPTLLVQGYGSTIISRVANIGTNTETFADSAKVYQLVPGAAIFTEGFENGGAIPASWTDLPGGTSAWLYDGGVDHGPNSAHGGSYAAYYNIYDYSSGIVDSLISPSINLSGGSGLWGVGFWFWHSSGSDSMRVYLDQGGVKTYLMTLPITSTWTQYTAAFSSSSANAKIYFVGYSLYGSYNLYLDDISIFPINKTNVYSRAQTVSNLASLNSTNATFSPNFTPASATGYQIVSFAALGTDLNKANDTAFVSKTALAHTGIGGPDAGYYSWADNVTGSGPAFSWKDISSIGTQVTYTSTTGDDRYTLPIPLGFSFYHYGTNFTKICVAENGFCSFDSLTSGPLGNTTIPTSGTPNNLLSLIWDDLKQSSGNVYFYTNNVDTCIVSYVNCKWYGSDSVNSFSAQMILSAADHKIKYQYQNLGPAIPLTHTIGIENGTGTVGLQYYYNSTPAGNLALPGLAITFAYNPPAHDIAATTLLAPVGYVLKNASFTPKTIFTNLGGVVETSVPVYFNIYDSTGALVYNNSQTIASLAPAVVDTVSFAATSLSVSGPYRCTTYVALPGDTYPSNDKKGGTFAINQHYGTGGPDGEYYYWIDNTEVGGPTYGWVDMSTATVCTLTSYDTGLSSAKTLGGSFHFYGNDYDSVKIGANGVLTFDFTQTSIPDGNVIMPSSATPNNLIAGCWDDLNNRVGNITYLSDAVNNRFVVQYDSVVFYNTSVSFDMQIILNWSNNTVTYQYNNIVGTLQTDYTIGIENSVGTAGLSYISDDNKPLNAISNGLAIKFYQALPAHEVATRKFLTPSSVGVINVPIVPQVVFGNNGSNDESSVPVRLLITPGVYNNTQTAVIDSGTSDTVSFASFTPTAVGVYTLTAIAELGTDVSRTNDTLKFTYTVFNTVVNFEANDGGLIPSGNGDWEWGTPVQYYYSSALRGPVSANSGINCWATKLDTNYTSGTSYLDFRIQVGASDSAKFGFAQWYSDESGYDGGNLKISTDDGATWVLLHPSTGYTGVASSTNPLSGDSIFTGTAHEYWHSVSFDLTPYNGLILYARLSHGADPSVYYAGWYLDDFSYINCSPYFPSHDMSTELILAPVGSGQKNVAVAPKVVFKNNANNTETSVPVRVLITQGAYNNAQTIASIGSMGTDTITFANFTPTVAGICTVRAIVTLGTDVDRTNDTLIAYYQVFDQVIDFESTNGGLQTGGGTDWQYGTPTYTSGPAAAHSGINLWGTNLTGTYTVSSVSDLLFEVTVGATGSAVLGWYQWYYYETGWDGGNVTVSTDNGGTWTLIYPQTGYTGVGSSANPLGQDSIFTGYTHNYWHSVGFDLSAYNGQIIQVKLSSGADGSGQYAGWYVDDFAFLNCGLYLPAHDIEVASINAPRNQLQGGQTYSINATIKNKGANTETFTVKASDNHGYNNTLTVTALPSLSSTTVTFPSWSITGCTSYVMTVVAQLGSDVNRANDTLQKAYDSYNPAGYNFVGNDSPGIENATLFYSPSNVWAAQFDVTSPATGALVEAVEFKFLTIGDPFWPWPDAVHDPIQGYIFIDGNNDGTPDATPLLVDTLLSADSGWTVWPIDCAEALRACNTTKFWAGVSAAETLHYEGLAMDSVLDYRDMYWRRESGVGKIDSPATGDKMIRASYDTSSVGSVHIAIGSLTAVGSAVKPASDTVSNTIDNTGSGCDMSYSATVIQDTPFRPRHDYGNIQPNSIRQSPIGFANTSSAKGTRTEPYYPPQMLRAGGPDAFGYRYKDSDEVGGPSFGWVDITGTGTALNLTDDDVEKVAVGFSFPYYGNTYDSIYIVSNGYLGFGVTSSDYSNDSIPNSSTPNNLIAIWWDDLNADSLPNIFYKYDAINQAFIVSYVAVPNYHPDSNTTGALTFQAILYANGNIKCQYLTMNPGLDSLTEATIGLENSTGSIGLQVAYNQAYMTDSLAILFTAPVSWLSTDLGSGTLDPAAPAMPFNIFMKSVDLDTGTYLGRVIVTSNDQSNPSVTINVSFTVTGGGGGDCDYLIGDISGDGQRLGGDVTYGVRYFKGVGATPKDSCFMDSTGAYIYVAGDCNGNCEFRGSDITRLVAYFKGIAHLSCCHWFPTTLPPIILRTDPTPIQQTNPGTAVVPRNDDQAIIGTQKTTR
jgi:hypothetical protein